MQSNLQVITGLKQYEVVGIQVHAVKVSEREIPTNTLANPVNSDGWVTYQEIYPVIGEAVASFLREPDIRDRSKARVLEIAAKQAEAARSILSKALDDEKQQLSK